MLTKQNQGFTFKRFFIAHDKSPMKVTTDSALLGAWAPLLPVPQRVLDLGTGCGILALMLAQRLEETSTIIDAIDLDANAVMQCQENVKLSPFSNINVIHNNIIDYAQATPFRYDLIITNPPYFAEASACRNPQRQQARYTTSLNHQQLLHCAAQLLTHHGQLCLILPFSRKIEFETLAQQQNWFIQHRVHVAYQPTKSPCLLLYTLCRNNIETQQSSIIIRNDDNLYSHEFSQLLRFFYLRC